jgi:hypothetical protein
MGRANKCPGLRPRGEVLWIDIDNERVGRIYESTGAGINQRDLAEAYYHKRLTQAYEEKQLGARRRRTFKEAADEHLKEIRGKLKSEASDIWAMSWALPKIGHLGSTRCTTRRSSP